MKEYKQTLIEVLHKEFKDQNTFFDIFAGKGLASNTFEWDEKTLHATMTIPKGVKDIVDDSFEIFTDTVRDFMKTKVAPEGMTYRVNTYERKGNLILKLEAKVK